MIPLQLNSLFYLTQFGSLKCKVPKRGRDWNSDCYLRIVYYLSKDVDFFSGMRCGIVSLLCKHQLPSAGIFCDGSWFPEHWFHHFRYLWPSCRFWFSLWFWNFEEAMAGKDRVWCFLIQILYIGDTILSYRSTSSSALSTSLDIRFYFLMSIAILGIVDVQIKISWKFENIFHNLILLPFTICRKRFDSTVTGLMIPQDHILY